MVWTAIYVVDGGVVYTEPRDQKKEVEYGEFFDRIIAAGGDESLLQMSDRKDALAAQVV